jgi:hypothetical protein
MEGIEIKTIEDHLSEQEKMGIQAAAPSGTTKTSGSH